MNTIQWYNDHLDIRIIMGGALCNIFGESHECESVKLNGNIVDITLAGSPRHKVVNVHLMDMYSPDGIFYHFTYSEPSGSGGTLIVARFDSAIDDEELDDDE